MATKKEKNLSINFDCTGDEEKELLFLADLILISRFRSI
jgi:hypothetical protein